MMDEGIHNIHGFTENQISDYVFGRSFYALKVLPTATGSIPKPNKKASAAEKLQYIACTMFQLGFSDGMKHYCKMVVEEWGGDQEQIEGTPNEEALLMSDIKYGLETLNAEGLDKVLCIVTALNKQRKDIKNRGEK